MTLRNFFMGRGLVLLALVVFGILFFIFKIYVFDVKNQVVEPSLVVEDTNNGEVIFFNWRYEPALTLNLDGNPNTNIFLEVAYANGVVKDKFIATTPMSCNTLIIETNPSYSVAQCYGAGLGYLFKVTKGENSYSVERKTFEEALPDVEPVVYQYETILEFPFESSTESSPINTENNTNTNIDTDKEIIIDKSNSNQKLNIKNKSECESNSGVWYGESNICEINSFSENMCVARGGEWNGCASACRHDKDAEVCTLQCVLTCSFR